MLLAQTVPGGKAIDDLRNADKFWHALCHSGPPPLKAVVQEVATPLPHNAQVQASSVRPVSLLALQESTAQPTCHIKSVLLRLLAAFLLLTVGICVFRVVRRHGFCNHKPFITRVESLSLSKLIDIAGLLQEFDVLVLGGTLGIFLAAALALRGKRVAVIERNQLRGRDQEWNISRADMKVDIL